MFSTDDITCRDANGSGGRCVALKNCPKLFEMLTSKPVSAQNRQFLKRSQCGFVDRLPYVCCSDEIVNVPEASTEKTSIGSVPDWLRRLRLKLPLPPVCGNDAKDHIVGGEVTEISEFPWLVLLEFTLRKYDNFSFFVLEFKN